MSDNVDVPIKQVVDAAELEKMKKEVSSHFINVGGRRKLDVVSVSSENFVLRMGEDELKFKSNY